MKPKSETSIELYHILLYRGYPEDLELMCSERSILCFL